MAEIPSDDKYRQINERRKLRIKFPRFVDDDFFLLAFRRIFADESKTANHPGDVTVD